MTSPSTLNAYLNLLGRSFDIQRQRVAEALGMKLGMISVSSTATIEAMKTDVKAGGIILNAGGVIIMCRSLNYAGRTIESKHWVQSSRYTDWRGPGGLISISIHRQHVMKKHILQLFHQPEASEWMQAILRNGAGLMAEAPIVQRSVEQGGRGENPPDEKEENDSTLNLKG